MVAERAEAPPGNGPLAKVIRRFFGDSTTRGPAPCCLTVTRRVRSWGSTPECLLHPTMVCGDSSIT